MEQQDIKRELGFAEMILRKGRPKKKKAPLIKVQCKAGSNIRLFFVASPVKNLKLFEPHCSIKTIYSSYRTQDLVKMVSFATCALHDLQCCTVYIIIILSSLVCQKS